MSSSDLALVPIWYVAFLFSTVCHEAAHALVAKWGGDLTAYAGGQVSLDPVPHVKREPFGLVVFPLLSLLTSGSMFGWGSAPYDPYWQIRYPRRAALMALAGPATNFLIAIVAACMMHVGFAVGIFNPFAGLIVGASQSGFMEVLQIFVTVLFVLNVLLGTLNLLPIPPLDGYSALGLILPEDIFLRFLEFARNPMFSLVGLVVMLQVFPYLVSPVLRLARALAQF